MVELSLSRTSFTYLFNSCLGLHSLQASFTPITAVGWLGVVDVDGQEIAQFCHPGRLVKSNIDEYASYYAELYEAVGVSDRVEGGGSPIGLS